MWDFLFDFLFEILNSFWPGGSGNHDHASRIGESEFERETASYWAKWGAGLALAAGAAYGIWWLWTR